MVGLMQNKRGIVFFYTLMVGVCIIILGIAFAPAIKQVIDNAMAELTCSTPANDFDQASCWYMDMQKMLFIGGVIFIGIAVIGAKVVYS